MGLRAGLAVALQPAGLVEDLVRCGQAGGLEAGPGCKCTKGSYPAAPKDSRIPPRGGAGLGHFGRPAASVLEG